MRIWQVVGAIVLAIGTAAAHAAPSGGKGVSVQSAAADGLRLTLEPARPEYEQWECKDAFVALTNVGNRRLVVYPDLCRLDVAGKGATPVQISVPGPVRIPRPRALAPCEGVRLRFRALTDRRLRTWRLKPGTYKLTGRYELGGRPNLGLPAAKLPAGKLWTGTLTTPAVTLRVMPDAKAYPHVMAYLKLRNRTPVAEAHKKLLALPAAKAQVVGVLMKILRQPDALPAYRAVEALGVLRATEAVDCLVGLLSGDEASLVEPAIVSLGQIGDKRATLPICAVLPRLPGHKIAVLRALRRLGDPRAAPTLRKYATDLYDEAGGTAMAALQEIVGEDWASHQVETYLKTNEIACVTRLTCMGPAAGPAVLRGYDRAVHRYQIQHLGSTLLSLYRQGHYQDRIAAALIRKVAAKDWRIRDAAFGVLVSVRRKDTTEALLRMLRDERDSFRVRAAAMLGKWKEPWTVKPLLAVLRDPKHPGRSAAIVALARFGDEKIHRAILAEFPKGNADFRSRCVSVMDHFGPKDIEPWIRKVAETDADRDVRSAARSALRRRTKKPSQGGS